jgi:NAD(P)H-hydrate epimerase
MQYVTSQQTRKAEELAVKNGLSSLQMMENAGRNLARFTMSLKPKKVTVLVGKGNNGAAGLAAARHLAIYGATVKVIFAEEGNENVQQQMKILGNIQEIQKIDHIENPDVVIDAMFGHNEGNNPQKEYIDLIKKANASNAKTVSIDIPTGINPDTGETIENHINSDYIMALGLPKKGLQDRKNIYLANIGIPNEIYRKLEIPIDFYFQDSDIVKIS